MRSLAARARATPARDARGRVVRHAAAVVAGRERSAHAGPARRARAITDDDGLTGVDRTFRRTPEPTPHAMGQKREATVEVAFTESEKECLVRLVKELQKQGAEGDKVRGVEPSSPPPGVFCFSTFAISPSRGRAARAEPLPPPPCPRAPSAIPAPPSHHPGRVQGLAQGDAEGRASDVARPRAARLGRPGGVRGLGLDEGRGVGGARAAPPRVVAVGRAQGRVVGVAGGPARGGGSARGSVVARRPHAGARVVRRDVRASPELPPRLGAE